MNQLIPKLSIDLLARLMLDKFGTELILDKTFTEMYLDDLDQVELLMEIEKELNIAITDDEWEEFASKPIKNWLADFREERIKQILEP
jgi:acyl carrier protein